MRPGLISGVNVDIVDIERGKRCAATLGYGDAEAQMVVEYALRRHQRGEEDGAQRTWISYYGTDMTSWFAILTAAVTPAARTDSF